MSPDREVDGEVTRVDAVRYLQGALGHGSGSLVFLLAGGVAWLFGYRTYGWILVVPAFLLSANGLSIWAWTRLVARFTARAERSDPASTRTLQVRPLSAESRAEMKAGALMTFAFLAVLLAVRVGLDFLDPRLLGYLCVVCLAVGNVVALAWSRYGG